jgi:hypothetical protein
MHIDNNPLSILLRLTLFFLLIYKIYELIKIYLVPFLEQKNTILQKQQLELLEKETLLTSTIKRVDNQMTQQRKMTLLLEKKIQIWHHITVEKHLEEERKQRSLALRLQAKRQLQERILTEINVLNEVIPLATAQAEKELTLFYAEEKGAHLLKDFINQFTLQTTMKQ